MKKKSVFLILLIIIVIMCSAVGCVYKHLDTVPDENLAKNAKVIDVSQGNALGMFTGIGAWAAKGGTVQYATIKLENVKTFNTITLIERTDTVMQFQLHAKIDGEFRLIYQSDKIGAYKHCVFADVTSDEIKLTINNTKTKFSIASWKVYNIQRDTSNFIVNDYAAVESPTIFSDMIGNTDYVSMFDVATDITFMAGLGMNADGTISDYNRDVKNTPEVFDRELKAVKEMAGDNANIYLNIYSNNEDISLILDTYADKLINEYLILADKYNLAGFDIDWEYPSNAKQWKSYSSFLIKFKESLQPKGLKLMIAIASWCEGLSKDAIKAIDYANLMLYDMSDPDYYHSSFDGFTAGAKKTISYGFKKSQILLGVPFYAREYANGGNGYLNYLDIPVENRWDNTLENFTYTDKNGNIVTKDLYFNSYQMIMDKTAYAIDYEYGGIMTWQFVSDKNYSSELSLHKAIQEAINCRK